ncbi:MAG: polysaccharide deacetylase family protein [Gemmatimonadetes bacterium]|nr:polysaccharide deacetylase family protein [Gemmatimonadota bacterium]
MGIIKALKRPTLGLARTLGAFELVGTSSWRNRRLMILCYHGISLDREHEWRRPLFMTEDEFQGRLEVLAKGSYSVIPLAEGLQGLASGSLPERSVALTFDDGDYGFYAKALPLLKEFGFPATVYLTTYYADHRVPVFHLICSYLMWKHQGPLISAGDLTGGDLTFDTRSQEGRDAAQTALVDFAEREGLSVGEKDQLARNLASILGANADELWDSRVLQLMTAQEVREIAAGGIDVELHTHRHRSPRDKELYLKELKDNRLSILAKTGREPVHFCYPSGDYRPEFLPWLEESGVHSATTCEPGLAGPSDHHLLLPRLVDHGNLSTLDFEGWVSGFLALLPRVPR